MSAEPLLLAMATGLLLAAALHDCVARTVPNGLAFGVALVGLGLRVVAGDALSALGCAGAVFALGVVAWRYGGLGGGDVKLLAAATLLLPPALVPTLILTTALLGGALAGAMLLARPLVPQRPGTRPSGLLARALRAEAWRIRRAGPLPYAVAIAGGALLTLSA